MRRSFLLTNSPGFLVPAVLVTLAITGDLLSAADPVPPPAVATEVVRGESVELGVLPSRSIRGEYQDSGYVHISRRDWSPPRTKIMYRVPAMFPRYWPERFYGEPGPPQTGPVRRYPIIAMPTDTTQMGYYYLRVPSWKPNPAMLPPIPRPSRWHDRSILRTPIRGNIHLPPPAPPEPPPTPPRPARNPVPQPDPRAGGVPGFVR